ncbi:hypothetical protein AB0C42_24320 [Micromonospora taraxaci]|uniref:hypothetical protein n=1 Tax=Micromonospora taraxaci TaxID=1316803 RepID=UPI0033CE0556
MDPIARIRETKTARDDAAEAFHTAIADAVRALVPVETVAAESGYHRNHVGRIARERGVPDARTLRRKTGHEDPS